MAEVIDAHHHVWHYTPRDFGWIDERMDLLRHDFTPADLQLSAQRAGVHGSVVVQARQTIEETQWLLDCASESSLIRGVVGWLPLADPGLPQVLHAFRDARLLKGLRHVIQDEADSCFILREDFNRGIDLLSNTDLVFDILIYEHHLPQTIEFIRRHPKQTFVIDHLAKPRIRERAMQPWKDHLKRLADFENVVCKCSGIATEADWKSWSIEDLQPYLDAALEAFGSQRLMAGSDWPVCLLATNYSRWWSILRQWALKLNASDSEQFLGGTAQRIYHLAGHANHSFKGSMQG